MKNVLSNKSSEDTYGTTSGIVPQCLTIANHIGNSTYNPKNLICSYLKNGKYECDSSSLGIYKYEVEIKPHAFSANFEDANTIFKRIYKHIRKEYGVTLFYLYKQMYATEIVEDCTKFRTMHKEREVTVIIRNQKLEEENVNNLILYNLFFKQIAKNHRLRFINSFLFNYQSTESSDESSI